LGLPGEAMTSWIEKRAEFQKRFDELSQENVQALITELNKAVGNYISKGGLSQDPNSNSDYNNVINLTQRAENIKERYSSLNDDILMYLRNNAKDTDMSGLLTENGELQKQINRLEKIQEEIKVDVESSITRDKLLRSRDTDVTRHQLFILDRPIRKGLIPYLWIISVLFIGIGLVILKMSMPSLGTDVGSSSVLYMVMEFITNKIVLGSLLLSALIVILFLSLKVAGVFGN
jgi:hypothetical protein